MGDIDMTSTRSGYWIWVTRPEFYREEDGSDREELLPGGGWGWVWTCHKDTKEGDRVLLYRTTPRKDIAYLLTALSDAETYSGKGIFKDSYVCEWTSEWKFDNPLSYSEMRNDAELSNSLGAVRRRFQGRAFEVNEAAWDRLVQLLAATNAGFSETVADRSAQKSSKRQVRERQIEDALANRLSVLPREGRLELIERQYIASTTGRIDLLCRDSAGVVVVEIKRGVADRNTFGQVSSYVGWIKKNYKGAQHVRGVVVSRGTNHGFEAALASNSDIKHVDLRNIATRLNLKIP